MDASARLIEDLSSWYWWVTVVLVGLALNVFAAYLKPPLDRLLSRASKSWRERSQVRTALFDAEVRRLCSSHEALVLSMLDELRSWLLSLVYLAFVAFFFLFAYIVYLGHAGFASDTKAIAVRVLGVAGVVAYLMFIARFRRAQDLHAANAAARDTLRKPAATNGEA